MPQITQNPNIGPRPPQTIPFNHVVDLLGSYATPAVGRVFMVRGDGTNVSQYDEQYNQNNPDANRTLYQSVESALAKCIDDRGDTIIVLPKHAQNIGAATTSSWTFKRGVRIIGIGQGSSIPTFTFTTATSKLNLNAVNVSITGCRFLCAGPSATGALSVATPFTMSAAGCSFIGNEFELGIDADSLCTTFLTVSAARCTFSYNVCESQSVASTPTAGIVLTAADKFTCEGNVCNCAFAAAGTGWIAHVTTASKNILIRNNFFHQWLASSTGGIDFSVALATTGVIANNYFQTHLTTNVLPIVTSGSGVVVAMYNNYVVNDNNQTGVLVGTVSDAS
jgi:hypothetical protein